ncbi:hypothetical protein PZT66_31320 [Pseudomonas aeruginosa]|uniref:hypothetical protein n=1 Tax=Pseudomonas aeruginosa TaxID=287 RepID=UPI0015968FFF|nr:hypothetical protein [Pseudomonas aeruginosa]ELK7306481.1 hypothetical protein [Pseudomonas aeruginosa]ELP0273013.1 hypothetical protein [Pseudomonas aeruginosa]MBG3913645.1 hypothetical protein [Pseudomonas aeruginosa]MBG4466111.1 hypothetical protein [Pseudomonas aeruginosa]MBG6808623.1 hypothetical protein [Pseudomonas aeruginosa]
MSKVQRFWCDEARNIRCVREDDFDALEAEAKALREEVAALRARGLTVSEDLLRRIERECRRESDWNCENVPAGTKAATTRAKKMLEIANDLRDLLGEQEEGNDVSNHQ